MVKNSKQFWIINFYIPKNNLLLDTTWTSLQKSQKNIPFFEVTINKDFLRRRFMRETLGNFSNWRRFAVAHFVGGLYSFSKVNLTEYMLKLDYDSIGRPNILLETSFLSASFLKSLTRKWFEITRSQFLPMIYSRIRINQLFWQNFFRKIFILKNTLNPRDQTLQKKLKLNIIFPNNYFIPNKQRRFIYYHVNYTYFLVKTLLLPKIVEFKKPKSLKLIDWTLNLKSFPDILLCIKLYKFLQKINATRYTQKKFR